VVPWVDEDRTGGVKGGFGVTATSDRLGAACLLVSLRSCGEPDLRLDANKT